MYECMYVPYIYGYSFYDVVKTTVKTIYKMIYCFNSFNLFTKKPINKNNNNNINKKKFTTNTNKFNYAAQCCT